ncbi:GspE/PulE family protein [Flagellatimonas centrodinii]|uniref:GspE/PulE family protein n=1 Tax=Flagellatimonas centrodinii TaxID=2806210 RepID=UPI001FED2C89|nr:GspE/PulE family protein [Flagellatimonas centrodinii]ULQ46856.1 GspE/PulE family protein [Flagellatimonas centrodinii]
MNAPTPPLRERRLALRELLDDLVADGAVSARDARECWVRQSQQPATTRHPLLLIADSALPRTDGPTGTWTADALSQWLATQSGLPYFRVDPLGMDVSGITTLVPYAYAARAQILPVRVTAEEVVVATAEPWWQEWVRDLEPVVNRRIRRVLANPQDIERYLGEFYALARSVQGAEQARDRRPMAGNLQNLEQLVELSRKGKLDAEAQPIVAIVDWLLQYAFESRASDIHLEPRREHGRVRFRIDGRLHDVYQIPAAVMPPVTSRMKMLARMDLAEKRRPQDGRIKTRSPAGREIELRVSALPTAFGEKLVMRIFDPDVLVKDFAALGFDPADEQQWRTMVAQPHGIVLVTGPTGSGKTTTLYTTLRMRAVPEVNICTIEDPIELVEPSFNQMQVNPAIGLNFADGVRALLRQDPDIIMIGEIRDLETAEVAVQAALTGHLVLSTLHTNDAPGAITRLIDLGVPPYLIRATLLGAVAQRLVRRLCEHCKQPGPVDLDHWAAFSGDSGVAAPATVYLPKGCPHCRETGFHGRIGLYEMLPLSAAVRAEIRADGDDEALRRAARAAGMTPLRRAAALRVAAGDTALAEGIAVMPPTL